MSLDKAIKHGKEHRKPYRGAKAVSKSSRNHGGSSYALSDRLHKHKRAEMKNKAYFARVTKVRGGKILDRI